MYIVYRGSVHYGQLHYEAVGYCETEQEAKALVEKYKYPDMLTYDDEPTVYYTKLKGVAK